MLMNMKALGKSDLAMSAMVMALGTQPQGKSRELTISLDLR
jgi:hypothetical protein